MASDVCAKCRELMLETPSGTTEARVAVKSHLFPSRLGIQESLCGAARLFVE